MAVTFPLFSLPVELQIEVLRHCDTVTLRRMKSSCRTIKNYIDTSAALDGVMFRTKKVDLASIERERAARAAYMIEVEKYDEQCREYDLKYPRRKKGDPPQTVTRHPLLDLGYWFGQNYEKIRAYSGEDHHKYCESDNHDFDCTKDENDLPRLHRTLAWRENATNPPVASMGIHDSWSYRTPLALHIRNKEVLYRDGDFEEGFVEINNDEDTPITVAQYWEHYCFYAKATMEENDEDEPGRRIDGTDTYCESYHAGAYEFHKKDHVFEPGFGEHLAE